MTKRKANIKTDTLFLLGLTILLSVTTILFSVIEAMQYHLTTEKSRSILTTQNIKAEISSLLSLEENSQIGLFQIEASPLEITNNEPANMLIQKVEENNHCTFNCIYWQDGVLRFLTFPRSKATLSEELAAIDFSAGEIIGQVTDFSFQKLHSKLIKISFTDNSGTPHEIYLKGDLSRSLFPSEEIN